MHVIMYTDGGSRHNPGPAAAGWVIYDTQKNELARAGKYLGEKTNNYAEYMAFILALEHAKNHGATSVECFADSKLLVEQVNGNWKVKHPDIKLLHAAAKNVLSNFADVSLTYIPREKNTVADSEVNRVLNDHE